MLPGLGMGRLRVGAVRARLGVGVVGRAVHSQWCWMQLAMVLEGQGVRARVGGVVGWRLVSFVVDASDTSISVVAQTGAPSPITRVMVQDRSCTQ